MPWSKTAVFIAFLASFPANAAERPCPDRGDASLRLVEVFDGPASELASLVPDVNEKTFAQWRLRPVYQAGRFVSVVCEYSDGSKAEAEIKRPVAKCDYKRRARGHSELLCE